MRFYSLRSFGNTILLSFVCFNFCLLFSFFCQHLTFYHHFMHMWSVLIWSTPWKDFSPYSPTNITIFPNYFPLFILCLFSEACLKKFILWDFTSTTISPYHMQLTALHNLQNWSIAKKRAKATQDPNQVGEFRPTSLPMVSAIHPGFQPQCHSWFIIFSVYWFLKLWEKCPLMKY
jgi:hypothetical protein